MIIRLNTIDPRFDQELAHYLVRVILDQNKLFQTRYFRNLNSFILAFLPFIRYHLTSHIYTP